MQSNEYLSAYDDYKDYQQQNVVDDNAGMLIVEGSPGGQPDMMEGDQDGLVVGLGNSAVSIDFNDPKIASLPRILLMGPRRGGKTSIQVRIIECHTVLCSIVWSNWIQCDCSCLLLSMFSVVIFCLVRLFPSIFISYTKYFIHSLFLSFFLS